MQDEKRGPGRPPAGPKMQRIKLLRGYVPSHVPEDRKPDERHFKDGVRAKAAPGSVIDLPIDEAKLVVKSGIGEMVFEDDEDLNWMTMAEKKAIEDARQRDALARRTAHIYAQKMAALDQSRDRG